MEFLVRYGFMATKSGPMHAWQDKRRIETSRCRYIGGRQQGTDGIDYECRISGILLLVYNTCWAGMIRS